MREQRSEEQVQQMLKSYSASNYDSDTMELIKADLEEGVEEEFINKYISRKLSFRQKAALSDAARSGVSFEFYNVLAKGFYSDRQITLLRNYYFKGIGAEQIENNINREMSPHAIKKVLDEVVKNVPMLKADSKEIQKEEEKSVEELVTAEAEQTNAEQKKEIENDHAVKTRVPGMYGDNVGYIWLKKEDIMEIHNGKTMLTYLDKKKEYKIYGKENQVLFTMKGEELYSKHYDKVEHAVRERYKQEKNRKPKYKNGERTAPKTPRRR